MAPTAPKIHSVHLGRRESTHLLRGTDRRRWPPLRQRYTPCILGAERARQSSGDSQVPPCTKDPGEQANPAPKIQESRRILHQRCRRARESSRGSQVPYYTKDTLRASWALREHAFTPGTVRGRWLHCTKDTLRASWVQGEIPTASVIHSERWSLCADDTLRASGAQRTHPSLRGGS